MQEELSLGADVLYTPCDPVQFSFATTAELDARAAPADRDWRTPARGDGPADRRTWRGATRSFLLNPNGRSRGAVSRVQSRASGSRIAYPADAVWVLFDGSPAATRALRLAAARTLLAERYPPVRFNCVPGAAGGDQVDALRRTGGRLLVLPQDSPLLVDLAASGLFQGGGYSIVLVR